MSNRMSIQEKMDYAFSAFGSIGIGREATLGALGSLAGESGRKLDTGAFNPNDPKGGSKGIAQHNGERRTAMENFKSKWGDVTDFRHQIDFVVHELQTTEKKTAKALKAEGITRAKAADTWTKSFERPKNPEAKMAERRANANYFAGLADKQAVSKAMSAPDAIAKSLGVSSVATPQSRPDTPAPAAAQTAQAPAPAQSAPGFDMGRFGAQMNAQTPEAASRFGGYAAPAETIAASFDMGRFGTPTAPSMSVATKDAPAAQAPQTQVAQAAPGFDMGRFGAPGVGQTRQMSPEAMSLLGYTPDKISAPAAAIAAAAPTQSLANVAAAAAGQPVTASTPFAMSRPEVAFAQPSPAIVDRTVGPVGAAALSNSNVKGATTFKEAFDGITGAISGVANGVNGASKSLAKGDITGALSAMPGGPTTSAAVAADAASRNTASAAKSQSFLEQDTNMFGAIGAIAGGVFGGAPGAVAGGLLGQGIGKALDGITSGFSNKSADKAMDSITGGVSRAFDGLFGGKSQAERDYDTNRSYGMPESGWNEGSFPNAPSGGSNQGGGDGSFDNRGSGQVQGAEDRGDKGTLLMATAPKPSLRIKFRQSTDYTQEQLVRDLIEYAQEQDKIIKQLSDRITALGG